MEQMEREEKNQKIIIKRIIVGPLETNCYLLGDDRTKEAIIIDPGDEAGKILGAIKENNLKPKFILLTHSHPDHTGAVKFLEKTFDIECRNVEDGDELTVGDLKINVIATPGHKEDSVCFIIGENIFSGDTLFQSGIGRTDLIGSDYGQMQRSLKRLVKFPPNFKVFPGHGPETTIGEEGENNPFLTF